MRLSDIHIFGNDLESASQQKKNRGPHSARVKGSILSTPNNIQSKFPSETFKPKAAPSEKLVPVRSLGRLEDLCMSEEDSRDTDPGFF